MKTALTGIKAYVIAHKVVSLALFAVIAGGSYWGYTIYKSTDGETRYVLGVVEKGTIVSSISASGQVSSSDETEVKPKVGGDVVAVSALQGNRVVQGQALATIDTTSARRTVTDAEIAVEEAEINLEHGTLQAPIDYKGLQEDVSRAKRDVDDAYEEAYTALAEMYVTLPDVISGADSILYDKDIDLNSQNVDAYVNLFVSAEDDRIVIRDLANKAKSDYAAARYAYTASTLSFKKLDRSSPVEQIGAALESSKKMAAFLSQAVASETSLIDTVVDILERRDWNIDPDITSAQTTVRTYVTSANGTLTSLSTAEKNIETGKDAFVDAEHALELASVGNPNGTEPFDIKLQQNTLKQKQAALFDAKQQLADHTIRAPFSGILAQFAVMRGNSVSSGVSVGTLISDQKIAEISLNEVDVAKVKRGNKATLTFDAVEELTLTGEVAEIDTVGTIVQGVVSYVVKIGFDAQDSRIKPGMTVNASIITEAKQNVLIVPSSAVKTQNGASSVQVFEPAFSDDGGTAGVTSNTAPIQRPVEIGISDDTNVEIMSGLNEGQQIIVRTISGSATATTQTNTQSGGGGFRGPGGGIRL